MFTTFIFIGQALRHLAATTAVQVRKNAGKRADDSFCAFSWVQKDNGAPDVLRYVPAPFNPLAFAPDLSGEYEVTPDPVDMAETEKGQVVLFFRKHYQQYVNIAAEHNKMYVCLIAVGNDCEACDTALFLTRSIDQIKNANVVVDTILLAPELAMVVHDISAEGDDVVLPKQNMVTIDMLKRLCAAKQDIPSLRDIQLIQNTNAQRLSLHLNCDTLSEVLAWRVVALTDSKSMNGVLRDGRDDTVASFGIACISFDRYYFLHFLLHHAYLSVMEREGVQIELADVNKVAEVAQKCVAGRDKVLTGFWEKYVAPSLNGGKKWEQIVPMVRTKMDEFITDLEKAMTAYIQDKELTLPEKRAVMAQILLSDDDLLAGALFDNKQLTFLDILKQPMAFFVDYNNDTTTFMKDDEGRDLLDPDTQAPIVEHSVLSKPRGLDGYIHLPIDDIKAMRIQIREASEYIRRMDDEIQTVRKQQNAAVVAQQVVVGEGFRFDDSRFKAANVFVEQPLTENYVAEKVTAEKNVDLSHDFSVVKDQAQVGACSAFAVTAVMEYILKKNKSLASDFSERFVYYNVREQNGRLQEHGASVSEVINSVAQLGVCPETLCPYSAEHVNDRPSDEAYTAALKHRIVEAKNIPLVLDIQHNIDQLKSAVAEGYPVIASFKVFKQMETGLPFITMPPDGEEGENHAMVICGFDDDTGFFKVRNSWGALFGDNGYCYMPYAYVGQKKYLNAAYIITQIASTDHVKGIGTKHRISFDSADTAIKIAILSSLRELKKAQQEQWLEEYKTMYTGLVFLNGNLKDKSKRDAIVDDAKDKLTEKKAEQTERLRTLERHMGDTIETFRSSTRRTLITMIIPAAVLVFSIILLTWVTHSWGWLQTILSVIVGIDVFVIVGFILSRERALVTLKNNLKADIDRQAALVSQTSEEIRHIEKRAFVAGMLIDSLSKLHDNLGMLNVSMKSFVNNLNAWYKEEQQSVAGMTVGARPPFLSILDNDALQTFFDDKEQVLTSDIWLWELMNSGCYDIDDQSVIHFKSHLRDTILQRLNRELDDFSIYGYWENPQRFPFLKADTDEFKQMLSQAVNSYSQVLLPQNNNQGDAGITIMLCHPADKTARLKADVKPYCSNNPQCENTTLRDALIVMQTQHVSISNISL